MSLILGLGSNEGDRAANLRAAIAELALEFRLVAASPVYESDAMLPAHAPDRDPRWSRPYLNLAVRCERPADPLETLSKLKAIERKLGRVDRERWAPRPIDIDLLAWDEESIESAGPPPLRVPHPGMLDRPFVLLPLADVAPEWRHPGEPRGPSAAERARIWRTASHDEVPFRTRIADVSACALMGVVNLTPDSFSDGGRFFAPEPAIARARALVSAGAEVLDLGAESTRPDAAPVSADEEWRRLEPVLVALCQDSDVRARARISPQISIDTRNAETARRALALGADWINDVTGFEAPAMLEAVTDSRASLVVMHSLGIPPSRDHVLRKDRDPIEQLLEWGEARLAALSRAGIARSRVILDPGIGFGKTARQSLEILRAFPRLHELRVRWLVGHSRKSFLNEVRPGLGAAERDLESVALSVTLARRGAAYLRVHEVELHARALKAAAHVDGVVRWR